MTVHTTLDMSSSKCNVRLAFSTWLVFTPSSSSFRADANSWRIELQSRIALLASWAKSEGCESPGSEKSVGESTDALAADKESERLIVCRP
mmetsp:Transcript_3016/g.4510  ORF Transcript_3016/g.4510 Transcript_3016/m.4510 type:complete len:91 (+) Transcript_3016:1661-1933(+)